MYNLFNCFFKLLFIYLKFIFFFYIYIIKFIDFTDYTFECIFQNFKIVFFYNILCYIYTFFLKKRKKKII